MLSEGSHDIFIRISKLNEKVRLNGQRAEPRDTLPVSHCKMSRSTSGVPPGSTRGRLLEKTNLSNGDT